MKSSEKKKNRLKVVIVGGAVFVVAVAYLLNLAWRYSGSGQWELVGEQNGVKMYSLKAPGSDLKKFKMILQVEATLGTIVKALLDPGVCQYVGCYESKLIEKVNSQLGYYTFRYDMGFPFKTREMVVKAHFTQNPKTKQLLWEVTAVPDKIPPNDCCFRVTDLNNTWLFTPLGDGMVELEYIVDQDMGGWMPDYLYNFGYSEGGFWQMAQLQKILDVDEYQNAEYDFLQELVADDRRR